VCHKEDRDPGAYGAYKNSSTASIAPNEGFEPFFLKPVEGLQNKGSKPSLSFSVSNNYADR